MRFLKANQIHFNTLLNNMGTLEARRKNVNMKTVMQYEQLHAGPSQGGGNRGKLPRESNFRGSHGCLSSYSVTPTIYP